MASASLGQVHLAILPNGEPVGVRVLRPGVNRQVETDPDIMLEEAMLVIPRQIQRMLEQVESGEANRSIAGKELDERTRGATTGANLLALAIPAAASAIGPALLIPRFSAILPERWSGVTVLVVAGFANLFFISIFFPFPIAPRKVRVVPARAAS